MQEGHRSRRTAAACTCTWTSRCSAWVRAVVFYVELLYVPGTAVVFYSQPEVSSAAVPVYLRALFHTAVRKGAGSERIVWIQIRLYVQQYECCVHGTAQQPSRLLCHYALADRRRRYPLSLIIEALQITS